MSKNKRCKDPRYFHNKYVQYPGKREYTEEEWDQEMRLLYQKGRLINRYSCPISCGPGDWREGGKCDKNGCYEK